MHVYARVRRKGRGKRRKEGERREKRKREERNTHNARVHPVYTRARARTRARSLASVERPLTLHFVVGVFYAFYCLSFSAPFLPPLSALDPHAPRPPSRLTRPVKKNRTFFALPYFLHDTAIYAAQRDF